jgi:hypothetical protein
MEFGLDSLMAVELRNRIGQGLRLPRPLPATLMFNYPTTEAIASYLVQEWGSAHAPGGAVSDVDGDVVADEPTAPSTAETIAHLSDEEVAVMLRRKLESL